jgi:hypothetical protein
MTRFGTDEVIHTQSFDRALSEKLIYRFGDVKERTAKVAMSHKVEGELEVIGKLIPQLKGLRAGAIDYVCAEIFTDKDGISRINICTMRESK